MKNTSLRTLSLRLISFVTIAGAVALPSTAAHALTFDNGFGGVVGLSTTGDPVSVASNLVAYVLSIIALIVVILIVYAGFMWMTAAGNEERVEKARDILKASFIGLVIILASYGIAKYVFSILMQATGTN